ncbi:hypothetical protein LWI29_010314 [Acer saccharum]|uniref:Uncharacterized protein n=1 Tax=Acer saccharum TaxID=4024 RepID=A0AA39RRA6_ACESA|nr:hypothetical protein LWI29_010314 [Acer saccharum]
MFREYKWKDLADGVHYQKEVDSTRVFHFLAGLNVEFDDVKGRIIGRQPLPPLNEVFAKARREESRRIVMLGKKEQKASHVETFALISHDTLAYKAVAHKPEEKTKVWVPSIEAFRWLEWRKFGLLIYTTENGALYPPRWNKERVRNPDIDSVDVGQLLCNVSVI